jgi:hypothetical protein
MRAPGDGSDFWRVPGLVLLIFSVPCLLGAIYMVGRSLWFIGLADEARGRVVEVSGGTPALSVEYRTHAGQTRVVRTAGSDLYANYVVGDALTVYYDADEPSDARADLFVEMWLLPIVLGVMGLFLFVPTFFFVTAWWKEKEERRADLDRNGQWIDAEYAGVRQEGARFVLRARWRGHLFESAPQIRNPEAYARGRKVSVLIDPRRPDRYRVEVPGAE